MSEETKNPLIESFLKLHELAGGTYQDTLKPAERARRAQFSTPPAPAAAPPNPTLGSENMTFSGGGPSGSALPNPTLGSSNMRFSSGSLTGPGPIKTGNPIAAGGGTYRPSIDTAPKIDNSASMNRAKTDYQTRVAGVERQNPILAPGKLESGNLQVGSRGDSVKELQRKLGIKDDGIFGKDTAKKLREFQQKNNLKVDGIYGRQSASAMNKQSGMNNLKKENPVGAYVSSQTVKPMSPMAGQGSSGADSKTLPVRNNTSAPVTTNSGSLLPKNSSLSQNIISGGQSLGGNLPAGLHGNTTYVGKDGKIYDRVRSLKLNNEEPEMTNKLIEAFMQLHSTNSPNLFTEAKKAKKLDPVGKEDEDIDNDGDKDKSDSYLHNRRKAIAKAMKEAKDPNAEGMVKAGTKAPEMVPAKDKAPAVAIKSDLPKDVANRMAGERERNRTEGEPGSRQRSMLDNVKKSAYDAKTPGENVAAFGKAVGARFAEPIVKAVDAIKGYEKPQSKVVRNGPNSSVVMKNEEVEHINESLNAAHKSAITAHLKKMWGKGTVSFDKHDGKHFATHNDGVESHVHSIDKKGNKVHVAHFMSVQESAEQLDELKKAALMAVRNRASGRMMDDPSDEKAYKVEKQASKRLKKITDAEKEESSKRAYKAYKEEVEELDENDFLKGLTKKQRSRLNAAVYKAGPSNPVNIEKKKSDAEKEKTQFYNSFKRPPVKEEIEFSEAELEHIAAILEANPIAPVPNDYTGASNGVSKRDLSDETVAEEEMKRGRGRPKGSTGSSKHGDGKGEGSEPKNLASQIRFSRPSGGNFMLKHPTTGVTKAVPAKAATEFYNKYTASEKPAQKQAHHDEFLAKHFGSSEKPKTGITLPKIPAPKS